MEMLNEGASEVAISGAPHLFTSQNLAFQIACCIPVLRLPAWRRCSVSCRRAVHFLLENNKSLRDELEKALSSLLGGMDKRVWVGIRLCPHDSSASALTVDRRRVVQNGSSEASFFFDQIFDQGARRPVERRRSTGGQP
eukprot:Skav230860  [mRNA]  locus=scaffold1335:76459:81323:- [translate_table: standard]